MSIRIIVPNPPRVKSATTGDSGKEASAKSLLVTVERRAKGKLDALGFPEASSESHAADLIVELGFEEWAKLLSQQLVAHFQTRVSRMDGEELTEYVARLRLLLRQKSLARSAIDLARRLNERGVVVPPSPHLDTLRTIAGDSSGNFLWEDGQALYEYLEKLTSVASKYGMMFDWEEPGHALGFFGPGDPKPTLDDQDIIPSGVVYEERGGLLTPNLNWFVPTSVRTLWTLLLYVKKARSALDAGNIENLGFSMFGVGRYTVLAGVEQDAVLGARVSSGGRQGSERDAETKKRLKERNEDLQKRVNDLRARRPKLLWTALSELVSKQDGVMVTGRRIRQVCKDPAPPKIRARPRKSWK